ncbi:MAG: hypothetical protein HC780_03415 [Leptolyngbyaceae cyanobacterium CSU_1_3]|nr:hypothetical protein [Leptolyngbyaceae cyanobacterium CSU_1_3]
MANNPIELRRKKYFNLSSEISRLDQAQLRSLFENSTSIASSTGWGSSHIIVLGQSKVFVKRILMTNLESDNLLSTRNFYDIPTYCNYGFGCSTGFGVFRELITQIKTTHWVLEGSISTFPLLYHYRIIPCSGQRVEVHQSQYKSYVEHWGNSENAGKYWLDRSIAPYELVLFLEYIPHILETWLWQNPDQLQQPLNDLRATIDFLRTKRIIHFDAHFRNILTDGEQIYLTDFGLVLDKSFALTKQEESFFDQHIFYDYGEVLRNLGHLIHPPYDSCSESNKHRIMEKYGIQVDLQPYEVRSVLLDNIEQIYADRDLKLDEFYVASIIKYRPIIALMQDFFVDMYGNNQKNTKLDHAKLKLLLSKTGFISD